jgi:hypothetical protein
MTAHPGTTKNEKRLYVRILSYYVLLIVLHSQVPLLQ